MLCDITRVHTGFGVIPRVTRTTDDADWGQPGSSKKVHVAKSLTQRGGFASVDRQLERKENQYWRIPVDEFQSWMLGFYRFVGEWKTTPLAENKIQVDYTYHLHSRGLLLHPFRWMFAQLIWRR